MGRRGNHTTTHAKAYKDNFWNKLRAEKEITYKELAEYVHFSQSLVAAWFSGYLLPSDSIINALCELFDVDPLIGKQEFVKAHAIWDAEHGLKQIAGYRKPPYVKRGRKGRPRRNSPVDDTAIIPKYNANVRGDSADTDFLNIVDALLNRDFEQASRLMYSKVNFDTFTKACVLMSAMTDANKGATNESEETAEEN